MGIAIPSRVSHDPQLRLKHCHEVLIMTGDHDPQLQLKHCRNPQSGLELYGTGDHDPQL